MPCPICGAVCKCKKAGPGGICCSCHRHKPRAIKPDFVARGDITREELEALNRHKETLEQSGMEFQRTFEFQK